MSLPLPKLTGFPLTTVEDDYLPIHPYNFFNTLPMPDNSTEKQESCQNSVVTQVLREDKNEEWKNMFIALMDRKALPSFCFLSRE